MPDAYDVVIAGAGLAGATAAFHLARTHRVLVLEAGAPASGASGIAAGTANPLMSLWARPVWRMEEALDALESTLEAAGATEIVRRDGLLRPAADERQARAFADVAVEYPLHATWLEPAESAHQYPEVHAPYGALWNGTALTVPISSLVKRLLRAAVRQGAVLMTDTVLMGWSDAPEGVRARYRRRTGDEMTNAESGVVATRRLMLAVGRHYVDFPELSRLRLHAVKGQLVLVEAPDGLEALPNLAGRGYVMREGDAFLLGSSYEHNFCDLNPTEERTAEILDTTAEMVPHLRHARIIDARAGVRVTVPGIRLPMVGPLPGEPNVWVFTALGSKGLLMAPLVALELQRYFHHPEDIPRDIRVRPASNRGR